MPATLSFKLTVPPKKGIQKTAVKVKKNNENKKKICIKSKHAPNEIKKVAAAAFLLAASAAVATAVVKEILIKIHNTWKTLPLL